MSMYYNEHGEKVKLPPNTRVVMDFTGYSPHIKRKANSIESKPVMRESTYGGQKWYHNEPPKNWPPALEPIRKGKG